MDHPAQRTSPPTGPGRVYLIGAGPGDPELLTLRGRRLLALADVVLYDYLAGEELLRFVSPDAELVSLGRHGDGKLWTQTQIVERMLQEATRGKTVARLKGGDPSIFGRAAEEIDALLTAGIPFEIVPGVTAASAAAAYAALPLTDRDKASCVALVTGQLQAGQAAGEAIDFAPLASFPGTLVFYMGVTTARDWADALLAHGKPGDTPVVLVRRCSYPDQLAIETTLAEVASVVESRRLRPPVLAIVGAVAARGGAAWFQSRPLSGVQVLVTRPESQADAMVEQLRELGAAVLVQPAIQILPAEDHRLLDRAIDGLSGFDWVVFSSANGVAAFMERLHQRGEDARRLSGCRLAAIGPATAQALGGYHLRADLVPAEHRSEALADAMISAESQGARALLIRASRGREVLAEALLAAGWRVEQAVAYRSTDVTEPDPAIAQALRAGEIEWVTVTSSAIARSLVALFGGDLRCARLLAISPLTAGVLHELGFPPATVAQQYTTEGLVNALREAVSNDGTHGTRG